MRKYLLIILFFSSCAGSSRIQRKERRENVIGIAFAGIVVILVAGQYGKSVSP